MNLDIIEKINKLVTAKKVGTSSFQKDVEAFDYQHDTLQLFHSAIQEKNDKIAADLFYIAPKTIRKPGKLHQLIKQDLTQGGKIYYNRFAFDLFLDFNLLKDTSNIHELYHVRPVSEPKENYVIMQFLRETEQSGHRFADDVYQSFLSNRSFNEIPHIILIYSQRNEIEQKSFNEYITNIGIINSYLSNKTSFIFDYLNRSEKEQDYLCLSSQDKNDFFRYLVKNELLGDVSNEEYMTQSIFSLTLFNYLVILQEQNYPVSFANDNLCMLSKVGLPSAELFLKLFPSFTLDTPLKIQNLADNIRNTRTYTSGSLNKLLSTLLDTDQKVSDFFMSELAGHTFYDDFLLNKNKYRKDILEVVLDPLCRRFEQISLKDNLTSSAVVAAKISRI